MAVTIRDVARAAGVSISTVSRALSAPDRVAEDTRLRVRRAARALGYHPNGSARGLITGRTGCIGLVVPDLENPFFGSICKGVQARARSLGYAVFIGDAEEDAAVEAEVIRSLVKQVDGLILCSPRGSDRVLERFAQDKPVVLINRRVGDLSALTFDNGGGVRAAMHHLVALGHRRIAYAGGPTTSWSDGKRITAFRACSATFPDLDLIELGHFAPVFAGGVQAGDLAIASGATAVMAYNDLMAVGVLDRLRQRGVGVPRDVSVTGFDDIPIAGLASPTLTAVAFPRFQMGRASVDVLMDVLGQDVDTHPERELPVQLVVRESTGVAATAPAPPRDSALRSIELPV
ncbi:MAG: LacI family DNA-binding transcriptional regulator [Propionibacteriaceae bacterium]